MNKKTIPYDIIDEREDKKISSARFSGFTELQCRIRKND